MSTRKTMVHVIAGAERSKSMQYDLAIIGSGAAALGVEFISAEATGATRQEHCFEVAANKTTYQVHHIIFATGAERRRLGLPNENELTGRGIRCKTFPHRPR